MQRQTAWAVATSRVGPRGGRQARRADLARRRGPAAADPAHPQGRATPARSTRWPPACWSAGSGAARSCSATSRSTARPTPRRSGSAPRPPPTTPRARSSPRPTRRGVTDAAIAAGIAALTGPIQQVPSAVSAIKVDGQRAYARVRAGEEVVLPARPVTVSAFTLLARRGADLDVAVECSSGTYVRALARDLGAGLGVGGHLTALRRTRVGPFDLEHARTLASWRPRPGCRCRWPTPSPSRSRAATSTRPTRPRSAHGRPLPAGGPGRHLRRLRPGRAGAGAGRPSATARPGPSWCWRPPAADQPGRPGRCVGSRPCSGGVGWTPCRPAGDAASSPSACSTACTAATSS